MAKTPEQQAMMDQMDAAAKEAGVALDKIMAPYTDPDEDPAPDAKAIVNWWKEWYPKAGHKRLGKLLVKYAG